MAISAFDLLSIGIGPSSSHTVGPMRAAKRFADHLVHESLLSRVDRVEVELFGSLGATGRGHASDSAIVLGLEGEEPATVDLDTAHRRVASCLADSTVRLAGVTAVSLDLVFHGGVSLPEHPNGMRFRARAQDGSVVHEAVFFSVGGGFVLDEAGARALAAEPDGQQAQADLALPFSNGTELLAACAREGLSVSEVMLRNEAYWRSAEQVRAGLLARWTVMQECVERGSRAEGVLPGSLHVARRAAAMRRDLEDDSQLTDPLHVMDWVNMWAMAVNEENAAGGRVVTAPTNGAAGIIPAVLHYYLRFIPDADDDGVVRFLLAAAAIGIVIKTNASISGAEVGCQGEVGSACAMAAAGLTEVLGGTPAQVEHAAEIGIEHNLGLTCDPIGGLVQIPCIERNAIASMKAINASRMALTGAGTHKVSLDDVVRTMRQTGLDMHVKYKETSLGGLAVNVVEC